MLAKIRNNRNTHVAGGCVGHYSLDGRQNNVSSNVHIFIPTTCGHVISLKIKVEIEIKVATLNMEIILDDTDGPSVITRVLKSGKERQKGDSEEEV